jgi:hypothetical protein
MLSMVNTAITQRPTSLQPVRAPDANQREARSHPAAITVNVTAEHTSTIRRIRCTIPGTTSGRVARAAPRNF